MMLLLLIVLGLIFGSFINAYVWRLHKGKDWVRGRSECTHCHHVLAAKDLVPVFSYLWLRGKCRYCRGSIEDTPLAEVLLAVWFAVSFLWWPYGFEGAGLFQFVGWLIASVMLVSLLIYDKRWFLLPDKVTYPLALLAATIVVSRTVFFDVRVGLMLLAGVSALILTSLFYLMFQVSKGRWIGGGDVKLAIALGLFAGTPLKAFLLLFVASLAGTIVMLPSLLTGKAKRNTQIPFGPFLIVGLLITVLFGDSIISWYTALLES